MIPPRPPRFRPYAPAREAERSALTAVAPRCAGRRLQRLATPTPLDKRISHGCINVPAKFYDNVVSPTFTGTNSIVHVLPEIRSNSETFASFYDVE